MIIVGTVREGVSGVRALAVALLVAAAACGAGAACAQAATKLPSSYRLIDLGPLGGPPPSIVPIGPLFVSRTTHLIFDSVSGAMWNFSSGTPVKTQYSVPANFQAFAMNDSGTVVGDVTEPDGSTEFGLWSKGTFTPMSNITQTVTVGYGSGATSNTVEATAENTILLSINDSGEVVGVSSPTCVAPISQSGNPDCTTGTIAVHLQGSGGSFYTEVPQSTYDGCPLLTNPNLPVGDFLDAAFGVDDTGTAYGFWCGFDSLAAGASSPVLLQYNATNPPDFGAFVDLDNGYPDDTFPSNAQINASGHMVFALNPSLFSNGFAGNTDIYYVPGSASYTRFTSPSTETPPALNDANIALGGATPATTSGATAVLLWQPGMPAMTTVPLTIPKTLDPSYESSGIQLDGIDDGDDVVGSMFATGDRTTEAVLAVPGCPAGQAGALDAGGRRRAHAAATPQCGLDVTIKPRGKSKAGLSRDDASGAAFISESDDKTCLSGCTAVEVTVKNAKHKVVKNASVQASVTAITGGVPDYPSGHPSPGYVCNAAKPTDCGNGNYLTGLKTDKHGHVELLYWAPGLTSRESATLTVDAESSCNASQCPTQKLTGSASKALSVGPNVIWSSSMTLDDKTIEGLRKWHESATLMGALKDKGIETLIEAAVTRAASFLIEEEEAFELAENAIDGASGIAGDWHEKNLVNEFTALFLGGFHVSPIGLGITNNGANHFTAIPPNSVRKAIAEPANIAFGSDSVMWRLAIGEDTAEQEHLKGPQSASLTAFEVSYCEQGRECGPGWALRPGIRSYIDFEMQVRSPDGVVLPYSQVVIPYNARAWMESQFREFH